MVSAILDVQIFPAHQFPHMSRDFSEETGSLAHLNGLEAQVCSMSEEIGKIVAGCRDGDSAAQRQLYEQYHRRVYSLSYRLVGRQDAADLTQEIFLRVFAGLNSFRGTAEFSTWLYRIAVNECLRHLRSRSHHLEPLTCDPVSPVAGPDQRLEQTELLERALAHLDERLRTVFLLRESEGLSYDQIAAVLEIPPGTVASQLNRARVELRAFLRQIE